MLFNRLHQFKQADLFDQIHGILLGYAKEVEDYLIEDIFLEVTAQYDFPILKTNDFGHHCPNTVLPVEGTGQAGRGYFHPGTPRALCEVIT